MPAVFWVTLVVVAGLILLCVLTILTCYSVRRYRRSVVCFTIR